MDHRRELALFLVRICTIVGLFAFSGCIGIKASNEMYPLQKEPCEIESLLIDKGDLPITLVEVYEEVFDPPSRVLASKKAIMFSTAAQGGAWHGVYGFRHMDDAKAYYKNDVNGWFSKTKFQSEWITPKDLENLGVSADIFDVRCSNSIPGGNETCRYFARYNTYVIELKTDTLGINHAELIHIIEVIDQKIASCFSEK